jgi:regulator of protease activity HflC (stomatin/prohibitin superfamily)
VIKPYPFSLGQTTKRSRWARFVDGHLPRIVIYLLVVTLVAVVLFPYVVVTVPSGYVGVLWKRFGNGTVLDPRQLRGEGLRFLLPWNQLFLYDLRLQSMTETYNAISGDGVSLSATMNVRFRLQRNAIPVLHQAVGPDYLNLLVKPGIGSLTREVMAEYTAEQVYSTARQEIQDKIRGLVESRLSQKMMEHEGEEESYRISLNDTIILFDTLVQGIELPQVVVGAINRKTEQYYISEEYVFRVQREKRESERKKIEAEGVRDFQQIVSQGISDSYLRWRGIEATLQLAQSNNSKVVIIGSAKDGLPIILGSSDTPPSSGVGQTSPKDDDRPAKETTATAGAAESAEKRQPAAPIETGSATAEAVPPDRPASLWPLSLTNIDAFLARMVRSTESKSEPSSKQQ